MTLVGRLSGNRKQNGNDEVKDELIAKKYLPSNLGSAG
jgi:hypothetical protein